MGEKKPWVAKGRYIGTENSMASIAECRDECGLYNNTQFSRANAKHIVKCVNGYDALQRERDALREALKNLLCMLPSWHEECPDKDRIPNGFCFVRWQDIREGHAALSPADGGKV